MMEKKKFLKRFKCECCQEKKKFGFRMGNFTREKWRCRHCYNNCQGYPIDCCKEKFACAKEKEQ